MSMSEGSRPNNSIVIGEALESSDEEESQFDRSESESLKSGKGSHQIQSVIVSGEAPESDFEDDNVSTVSLVSSGSVPQEDPTPRKKTAGEILKESDPILYRKHVERNRSLRRGIAETFLEPVIAQSTKKVEKFSQNLSSSQVQMQEALLQSRIATGNLLRLQIDMENFKGSNHLGVLRSSSETKSDSN